MSDLFRDFLVWLMSFAGCSVLVFVTACYTRNRFKNRQKQVAEKLSAGTDASSPAANAQLSPRMKWLVFALAPILYLLLLGPALCELNNHFQKIQSERAALSQAAENLVSFEPIPDSLGARGLSREGYRISKNPFRNGSSCSCRKKNQTNTPTQSANPDVSSDDVSSDDVSSDDVSSDDVSLDLYGAGWEASPDWEQLSTGDMHGVAEGDVAEVGLDAQVD